MRMKLKGIVLALHLDRVLYSFPRPTGGCKQVLVNLSYTNSKNKTNDDTSNQFGINYGYVGFGIAYYFRRKVE